MSTSLILDSDACKFSAEVSKFLIVCSNLFWKAPSLDLSAETTSNASFIVVIALFADACSETSIHFQIFQQTAKAVSASRYKISLSLDVLATFPAESSL